MSCSTLILYATYSLTVVSRHKLKPLQQRVKVRRLARRRLSVSSWSMFAGGSLAQLLNDFGPLSDASAAAMVTQILLGLQYLHSKSVIHCDIKPENILVESDGTAKLSDFGTAVLLCSQQQASSTPRSHPLHSVGARCGTPLFMAPEVLLGGGDKVSPAVDVWALGCTVMVLFTGRLPWAHLFGGDARTILRAVACSPVEADLALPTMPNASERAVDFVAQALHRSLSRRATIAQLLAHPWIAEELEDSVVEEGHGGALQKMRTRSTTAPPTSIFAARNESERDVAY